MADVSPEGVALAAHAHVSGARSIIIIIIMIVEIIVTTILVIIVCYMMLVHVIACYITV